MAERDLQKGKETRHVNPFAEGSLDGPVRFRGSRGRLSSAHSAGAADCSEDSSILLRKMGQGRVKWKSIETEWKEKIRKIHQAQAPPAGSRLQREQRSWPRVLLWVTGTTSRHWLAS